MFKDSNPQIFQCSAIRVFKYLSKTMINYIRPLFAFSLIPLGILVSLSISFTNLLGPPSTKLNYDTSEKSSLQPIEVSSSQTFGGKKVNQAIDLAEKHVTAQKLIHDFSELDLGHVLELYNTLSTNSVECDV